MSISKKLKRYVMDRDYRFGVNEGLGAYRNTPDEQYLKRKFKVKMGYPLNLEVPKTFSEKLQWLKLYDRKPEYTKMVDKFAVRAYIAEAIGEQYLIPLLGVWDDPDEIDFDALPDQFVLKCNHNSGLGMCICKDKAKLNVESARKELRRGLQQDYYKFGREWPYKNVKPCIIAEQYMESECGELSDYKVHCFNGIPKFVLVCKDRFTGAGLTEDFFDPDWKHLPMKRPSHDNAKAAIAPPENLSKMLELASLLAKDLPFGRVDFYEVDHKLYFGEITFFPASGFAPFEPESWDETLGSWLALPEKKKNM